MQCYARWRPNGKPFYVDENGNEVDEQTAKQHLVEGAQLLAGVPFVEGRKLSSRYRVKDKPTNRTASNKPEESAARIKAAASGLNGMSEREAELFATGRDTSTSIADALNMNKKEFDIFADGLPLGATRK
jgi:hypothetical protein